MSMEQKTHFEIDKSKCVKCGKCVNTCSGMVIEFGPDGYPRMKEFERFGWRGCWRCQHCLAVCPQGAISIFGKDPEDSLPPPPKEMGEYMERLVVSRRSCRRFLDKNVDSNIVTSILSAMAAVPTGGNAMGVEYTVIDDKEISEGDYMGIGDAGILSVNKDLTQVVLDMLDEMADEDSGLITLYSGADVKKREANKMKKAVAEHFPNLEVELQVGGQPVYYYVTSVE